MDSDRRGQLEGHIELVEIKESDWYTHICLWNLDNINYSNIFYIFVNLSLKGIYQNH